MDLKLRNGHIKKFKHFHDLLMYLRVRVFTTSISSTIRVFYRFDNDLVLPFDYQPIEVTKLSKFYELYPYIGVVDSVQILKR